MLLRFLLTLLFKIPDRSVIKSRGGFYSRLIHRTSFLLALIIQYILKNEPHQCSHITQREKKHKKICIFYSQLYSRHVMIILVGNKIGKKDIGQVS